MFFFHMRDLLLTFSPFVGELNSLDVLDLHTLVLISTSKSVFFIIRYPFGTNITSVNKC